MRDASVLPEINKTPGVQTLWQRLKTWSISFCKWNLSDTSLGKHEKETFWGLRAWDGRCESKDPRSPGQWNVSWTAFFCDKSRLRKNCYVVAPRACSRLKTGTFPSACKWLRILPPGLLKQSTFKQILKCWLVKLIDFFLLSLIYVVGFLLKKYTCLSSVS